MCRCVDIPGGDEHHADEHDHEGDAVVELEGEVVDGGGIPLLEVGLDGPHHAVHGAALTPHTATPGSSSAMSLQIE